MISVLGVLVEISQPWVSFPVSSFEEFELLINTSSESESTRDNLHLLWLCLSAVVSDILNL